MSESVTTVTVRLMKLQEAEHTPFLLGLGAYLFFVEIRETQPVHVKKICHLPLALLARELPKLPV
jgi:hypothetical protein